MSEYRRFNLLSLPVKEGVFIDPDDARVDRGPFIYRVDENADEEFIELDVKGNPQ